MRDLRADRVCRAISRSEDRDGEPPQSAPSRLARFGRLSLVLGVYAAIGTAGFPFAATAAPRHPAHVGHGGAATLAAAGHGTKPGRAGRAHPATHTAAAHRSRHARVAGVSRAARPGRVAGPSHAVSRRAGAVRSVNAVHRDVVPLANTTWDDPAVPPVILDAIQTAARESGIDPHLLAAIAWRESRFDPDARNQQSSAKGLLQFTSGTWLRVVRDYGSAHDAAEYAAAIHTSRSGDLVVSDSMRSAILQLRSNPTLSAKLAAQSMRRQRAVMEAQLGRPVTSADLYLMHVLGPTGAMRFLTAQAKRPSESSLKVASFEVMRNAGLLAQDGRPLTVANTYAAAETMLNAQHAHSAPLLTAVRTGDASSAPPAAAAAP